MKKNKANRLLLSTTIAVFIAGTFLGIYLHAPALKNPYIFADDFRQSVVWMSYRAPESFQDSIICKYSEINRTPFMNGLYRLGSRWIDPLLLSKLFAVLFFGLNCMIFFLVGYWIKNLYTGFFSVFLFAVIFELFRYSVGGFAHGFMMPFVALTILLIAREKWKIFLVILPLEILIYPMAGVFTGVALVLNIIIYDLKELSKAAFWRRKGAVIAIAGVIALGMLLSKYSNPPRWYGHIVTRTDIRNRVVFTRHGRYPLSPVPGIFHEFKRHLGHPLIWISLFFFLVVHGKKTVKIPRGCWEVFLAGIILYKLADWFLMRLYIPDRYTKYVFPVVVILFMSIQFSRFLDRIKNPRKIAVFFLILSLLWMIKQPRLNPGMETIHVRHESLYRFLASLPPDTVIAAPPYTADNIPVFSRKRVLFNYELSHPWITGYWKIIRERTLDFYRAYFSTNPQVIRDVSKKYHITHWVVKISDYRKKNRKRARYYFQPFQDEIRGMIKKRKRFYFQKYAPENFIYRDSKYMVLSTRDIPE